MKTTDIKEGRTYANRGAGRTTRRVVRVSDEVRPARWLGAPESGPPQEPGVLYEQSGTQSRLYLSSFAAWAGKEVSA